MSGLVPKDSLQVFRPPQAVPKDHIDEQKKKNADSHYYEQGSITEVFKNESDENTCIDKHYLIFEFHLHR
jgi:hypothetical protein